ACSNMKVSAKQTTQKSIHIWSHMLWGRICARRLRYMQKDGRFPVSFQKSPGDWNTYFIDIFTTLVEIRWRVMFLVFSLSYILSWLFFGLSYWLIAHVHGDTVHLDNNPCVENVRGFTAAFLFSMETQATIGYGFRGMTENCMVAIVVVTFQDVLSCLLDTIIIGIIVAFVQLFTAIVWSLYLVSQLLCLPVHKQIHVLILSTDKCVNKQTSK
uniref:Potassium channel inwardly rectifying transmembrane domain-containing protein n=1 Tax=Gouania willdenowi TaxID=441366 RepID=A0A8C5N8V1_GOUWI